MLIPGILLMALSAAGFEETAGSAKREVSDQPKTVPVYRDEMKEALDRLKYRTQRLPRGSGVQGEGNRGGERGRGNREGVNREGEGRRGGGGRGGFGRDRDPKMTLDYPFSVELFWIVSRVNNCHYCLGHQENKLLAAGLDDDRIAALDGDWEQFTPAEQAAFAFTRKLTYEPHRIDDADIARLKEHFTPLQALEIVFYVSRYNSTNRSTDGRGLVQGQDRVFTTPTSEKYRQFASRVAPIDPSLPAGTSGPALAAKRPELESREQVLAMLAKCRDRHPRFSLVDEAAARELASDWPEGSLPNYVRLLANFPASGIQAAQGQRRGESQGELPAILKAQISWIAARNDRAWYALGRARHRLKALEQSDDDIFALDAPDGRFTEAQHSVFRLTRKIATAAQLITDADVDAVRRNYGDELANEVMSQNTQAAFFDRLTESAALPLDE